VQNLNQIKTHQAYHCMLQDSSHNKEKINHALSECTAWLTSLNLLKEESYSLKTILSEALDKNTDKELVAEAENFHNLIIVRDEYIRDIAADTKSQGKKLQEAITKTRPDRQWVKQQQKLRNEIAYLEMDFANMRDGFYRKFLKKATL
jgi:chaperonin cofactor prefoldin